MKRFVLLLLSLICLTFAFYFVLKKQNPVHMDKTSREYAFRSPISLRAYLFDQKKIKKSRPKYDRPNEAMQYEVALRSEIGKPFSYQGSWRMRALQETRQLASLQKVAQELNWTERGPANIGGRTRAIVVHPLDPDSWWVGAVGGGIWHSQDGGLSWECQSDNLSVLSTTAIDICRDKPNVLYAGTGEGFYNYDAVVGDGIFKTDNGGTDWQQLNSTISNSDFRFVNRIIVHPQHPDTLLAATNTGLFRSLDGGQSWTTVFSLGSRVQQIIANPLNFNTQFIAVNTKGIYRSTDMGEKWNYVSEEIKDHQRIELSISQADTNYLYAAAVNGGSGLKGFYKSTDNGKAWKLLGNSPNWLGGQGWYDNTLVVDPSNPDIVIVGGIDLYKVQTSGSGMIADPISNWYGGNGLPYVHADQHFLVTLPRNDGTYAVIAANDGGIFYSSDKGTSWVNCNNNFNVTQYYDADRNPFADQFIAGSQDNGTNLSPGDAVYSSHWKEVIGGDGFDCVWHNFDPYVVYGTLYSSLIYKSTDGGNIFRQVNKNLPESGIFHTPLTMDPHNPNKLFTISGTNQIYYSTNGAESWHAVGVSLGGSGLVKIAVCESDSYTVWAASSSQYINLSTDAGKTYSTISKSAEMPNAHVTGIATYPDDNAAVILTFGVSGFGKIFRSRDLGASWENITANLPDIPVHCAIVMPYDTRQIWIGTDIGLFISYDDGQSWQYPAGNLPAVSIRRLKIVNQEIVAATHGRGVWSIHDDMLPQLEIPTRAPDLVNLNPPHPTTNLLQIHFIARGNYDSLSVRVNQKSVATLFNIPVYRDTFVTYVSTPPESLAVKILGFKGGVPYPSNQQNIKTYAAVDSLKENFDGSAAAFYGDLTIKLENGFSSEALHTIHPYYNKYNYIAYLGTPIRISSESKMTYRDVALVEPGEPGFEYPDDRMWDYVTVEGSLDGEKWDTLIKPYDCRFNADWKFFYESNMNGEEYMLLDHEIDLGSFYPAGQNILLRFRLFADEYMTGWGWAIDDVRITGKPATAVEDEQLVARQFRLLGNYPNPFNPVTVISYQLPVVSEVELGVYNLLGQKVVALVSAKQPAGDYRVEWDATGFASGVYFYRMSTHQGFVQTRKMMLLK